jgi:hypothetical protein
MKLCLVCQWMGDPPEWTCPMCGEASWAEQEELLQIQEPAPKAEPSAEIVEKVLRKPRKGAL